MTLKITIAEDISSSEKEFLAYRTCASVDFTVNKVRHVHRLPQLLALDFDSLGYC